MKGVRELEVAAALPFGCRVGVFFQAEDGIRDGHVTGVQTCALPILLSQLRRPRQSPRSAQKKMPGQSTGRGGRPGRDVDDGAAPLVDPLRWNTVAPFEPGCIGAPTRYRCSSVPTANER